MTQTFFVLGDQLSTEVEPWPTLSPDTVILMIESEALICQPHHLTRGSRPAEWCHFVKQH